MIRRQFGRIRELPSGRWQARYPGPDGKDRSAGTFATRRDAARALAAIETDLARGTWTDHAAVATLEEYATSWLRTRALRPRTREQYADHLRLRILPTLGHVPLNKINPVLMREWHARMTAEAQSAGLSGATVSGSYRVLRAILNTAIQDELIQRNPCVLRGAGKDPASSRPTVSERDVWALARAVPERYQTLVWLAAGTALRSAELAALRRRDINLEAGTLRVERAYIEPDHGQPYFGPPKSDAGVRTVNVPSIVLPMLREHLDRFSEPGPDGLVFTSEKGQPMSRHNRKWWRDACRTAGVDPKLHLHDLRHAGLTLAAQAGATLKELMALAGHSSARAAMIYQHAADGRASEIARGISDRLSRGRDESYGIDR